MFERKIESHQNKSPPEELLNGTVKHSQKSRAVLIGEVVMLCLITFRQLPLVAICETINCQAKINKMRNLKQQINHATATGDSCVL